MFFTGLQDRRTPNDRRPVYQTWRSVHQWRGVRVADLWWEQACKDRSDTATTECTQSIKMHYWCIDYINISTASLPGMWERTVTIGSGGKTFSATGWKVMHILSEFIGNVFFLTVYYYNDSFFFVRLAGSSAPDTSWNTWKPSIRTVFTTVPQLLR